MIASIKRIKDVGVFKDFETRKTGLQKDFCKKNFIFGPNTYGKSTLCDILKDISDNSTERIIRSKDTKIEMLLRKALYEKGIRYRKTYDKLLGKPDIVLTKYKIAIFCDGEFFHGKDWEVLKPRLEKSNNSEFWISKIARNRERDDEINKKLLFLGWTVIRFWGNNIKKDPEECIRVIEEAIFDIKMQEISYEE